MPKFLVNSGSTIDGKGRGVIYVGQWSCSCIICATHNTGRAIHSPLTPIPVAGPFQRIRVDVVKLPKSKDGNCYAVVFVDYLTKWPEVFPVSAATIAMLF